MSEHISRATQLMGSVVVALSMPTVWLAALGGAYRRFLKWSGKGKGSLSYRLHYSDAWSPMRGNVSWEAMGELRKAPYSF
jgi:hypothetical protein